MIWDGQAAILISLALGVVAGSSRSVILVCAVAVALGVQLLAVVLVQSIGILDAAIANLAFNIGVLAAVFAMAAKRLGSR